MASSSLQEFSSPGAQRIAILGLVTGAVVIAFAPILVRLSELGPSATGFYRFLFAIPLYWVIAAALRTPRGRTAPLRQRSPGHRDTLLMILAGACLGGDIAVWHFSIEFTTVANATLLANVAPVFVVLAGWILFRTAVTRTFLIGLAAAMSGILVLSQASLSTSPTQFVGDLFGVMTAVFYAAYQMIIQRLRIRYSTIAIMIRAVPVSALIILPIALVLGETMVPVTIAGWVILIALGTGPQFMGQGLIAWALAHLPVAFASISLLVQPVTAAALAWVMFDEQIGLQQGLGAVAVLAGIILARRGSLLR